MIAEINYSTGGAATTNQDFAKLVELLTLHSTATNLLDALESKMSQDAIKAAVPCAAEYVVHQESVADCEKKIKALFAAHPEWREENSKTVKTPFGEVAQRTVTELEVPNPAMTVALIQARGATDKEFKAETFLRVETTPNIEALEGMSDDELNKLGVRRVSEERISVKPAKVSAAKAVKAAGKKAEAKAA